PLAGKAADLLGGQRSVENRELIDAAAPERIAGTAPDGMPELLPGNGTEVRGDGLASVSAGPTPTRLTIDIQLDRPTRLPDQDEVTPFAVVDGRACHRGRLAGLASVLTNLRLKVAACKPDVNDGPTVGAVPLGHDG